MQSEEMIGAYNALVKEINSLKDPMQEQSDAKVPFESDISNCTVSSTTQPFGAFFYSKNG
jgi:flagellar capping protein FliD